MLVTGLCPLIPLPFVDDWAIARLRRRLITEALAERGLVITPPETARLAADPGITLSGCLWAIVLWPIKKLVRMALFFLMAKSCLDAAAETAHRLTLLDDALEAGHLPGDVERVARAVNATLAVETPSPVKRALRRELELSMVDGDTTLERLVTWLHLHGGGRQIRARFVEEYAAAAQSSPTV